MKEQSKEQWKVIKSAAAKSLVTTCCGLMAFFLVSLLKVVTDGDGLKELGVILTLLIIVMVVYVKYISNPIGKRAKEAGLSRVLRREAVRSSFNSFIVFYSGFEIYYALVGFVSLKIDSAYESLSELVQDRAVISGPISHIFETLAFYFFASWLVNVLFNYMTSDSESNASAHNSVESPSPSA
ncbi:MULTISPECIES: hypothetical protein [Vibrio harveyi group]|uniref:hypothetical protein n=1 Tax=Vibrio harveyi group TaxID=717610 RepID=UPI00215F9840|nr:MULTISPECIES: hypothetical protein [Vibrio harveyi group]HCH2100218.1 hypothetical protein [Vibrio parahaemolyticus]EKD1480608.1 hypothetical protein [Vibrio alginolyticus]MCS0147289.1 hypothetical protein [Vibrio alginolyticus]MCS0174619.1 hypothetical protein [Vibrio alginolyticus]MCS0334428.1 hypothetical protein [Vibrio diabolicus]